MIFEHDFMIHEHDFMIREHDSMLRASDFMDRGSVAGGTRNEPDYGLECGDRSHRFDSVPGTLNAHDGSCGCRRKSGDCGHRTPNCDSYRAIFSLPSGHSPRRNARMAAYVVTGSSSHIRCAAPGTVTSLASGSWAAQLRPFW